MLDFAEMRKIKNIDDAKAIIEKLIEAFEDKYHALGVVYGLSTIGLRCNNPQEFYKALRLIQNATKHDVEKKADPILWVAEHWENMSVQFWDLTQEEIEERQKTEEESKRPEIAKAGDRTAEAYTNKLEQLQKKEPALKKEPIREPILKNKPGRPKNGQFKRLKTSKEVRKQCGRKKKSGSKIEKRTWD
jgi:hypothetical protein